MPTSPNSTCFNRKKLNPKFKGKKRTKNPTLMMVERKDEITKGDGEMHTLCLSVMVNILSL